MAMKPFRLLGWSLFWAWWLAWVVVGLLIFEASPADSTPSVPPLTRAEINALPCEAGRDGEMAVRLNRFWFPGLPGYPVCMTGRPWAPPLHRSGAFFDSYAERVNLFTGAYIVGTTFPWWLTAVGDWTLAHEWGHAVQFDQGTMRVRPAFVPAGPHALELDADCSAGVFLGRVMRWRDVPPDVRAHLERFAVDATHPAPAVRVKVLRACLTWPKDSPRVPTPPPPSVTPPRTD